MGDIDKDVRTGINAGMSPILVETGKAEKSDVPANVKRCKTAVEAVELILSEGML